jgi:hypothetical protein
MQLQQLRNSRRTCERSAVSHAGEGVKAAQVSQVRGYTDLGLPKPEAPEDASNRRISLIVQYLVKTDEEDSPVMAGSATSEQEKKAKSAETSNPDTGKSSSQAVH